MIGAENEVHSLEVSGTGPCPHKTEDHQQIKDKSSTPQNQKREQPLVGFVKKKV